MHPEELDLKTVKPLDPYRMKLQLFINKENDLKILVVESNKATKIRDASLSSSWDPETYS